MGVTSDVKMVGGKAKYAKTTKNSSMDTARVLATLMVSCFFEICNPKDAMKSVKLSFSNTGKCYVAV